MNFLILLNIKTIDCRNAGYLSFKKVLYLKYFKLYHLCHKYVYIYDFNKTINLSNKMLMYYLYFIKLYILIIIIIFKIMTIRHNE